MNHLLIAAISAVVTLVLALLVLSGLRRKSNKRKYTERWQDLQRYCASKETWPLAIITADKLLDEALRNHRIKGKSTGERLVAAQHKITDNDAVWYSHNLAKKLIAETTVRLNQADVKKSLVGFRQALKDLGVVV